MLVAAARAIDDARRMDLHQGFREPAHAPAHALAHFLEEVDRLPGIRAIRAAMREAVALKPGTRLLDAGCGSGIETARLAEAQPRALVTGLDRNVELLRDAPRGPRWLEGDLHDPGLPAGSFDVVRTERVLMYVPDLHRALDALRAAARARRAPRALRARLRRDDPRSEPARRPRRGGAPARCWTARSRSRAPAASSRGCWPSAARATSSPGRSRSRSTSRSGGGSSTPRWRRSPTPSCWPTSTTRRALRCWPPSPAS